MYSSHQMYVSTVLDDTLHGVFVLCAMWPWDIITKGESKNQLCLKLLKVLKHIIMYPFFQNNGFLHMAFLLCLLLVPFLPRQQSNNEQVFMGGLPGLTIVQNSLLTMPFCCHWYSIVNYLFTLFLTSLSSLCGMHVHMACPTLLSLPPSLFHPTPNKPNSLDFSIYPICCFGATKGADPLVVKIRKPYT